MPRVVCVMIQVMKGFRNISNKVRQSALTAFWLLLAVYFAFHAFQGENSLAALKSLKVQEVQLTSVADRVADERETLERRVSLLDKASLDPDMLEEQVRKKLGFTHPDEVVLIVE